MNLLIEENKLERKIIPWLIQTSSETHSIPEFHYSIPPALFTQSQRPIRIWSDSVLIPRFFGFCIRLFKVSLLFLHTESFLWYFVFWFSCPCLSTPILVLLLCLLIRQPYWTLLLMLYDSLLGFICLLATFWFCFCLLLFACWNKLLSSTFGSILFFSSH